MHENLTKSFTFPKVTENDLQLLVVSTFFSKLLRFFSDVDSEGNLFNCTTVCFTHCVSGSVINSDIPSDFRNKDLVHKKLSKVIPFNKPFTDHREAEVAKIVLESGILRGDGPRSSSIQKRIQKDIRAKHVFFTTSCTHALEMAMLSLNLKPGDEVIMPSFTFVSSANAVVLQGAKPVFADISEGTLNLNPQDVAEKITKKTRAVIPVHYAGVSVDMDELELYTAPNDIRIIEDAAQGVDAYYKNKHLGTIGDIGCFSFHETKNITCGEGGAFITNSKAFGSAAEIIREKGTNRSAFLRGEVDKYTWINRGSSYIQSDILAGILDIQWDKRAEIKMLRKRAWKTYHSMLKTFEDFKWLNRPVIPPYADSNFHTYFINTRRIKDRDPLLNALKKAGISATFHYVPLHNSPFGKQLNPDHVKLSITERLSATLIRLPLYAGIDNDFPDFAERTAEIMRKFFISR